jgi:hypothetical protein
MQRIRSIYPFLIVALLLATLSIPSPALAICGEVRGFWQFENTLTDASGCNNHGSGSASYPTGYVGQGLLHTFAQGRIPLTNAGNSLEISGNQITLEAWVKSADYGSDYRHIIDKVSGYTLSVKSGRIAALLHEPGIVWGWFEPAVQQLTVNTWHYLVATYDGTADKLYVDSVLVASRTLTTTQPINPGGQAGLGAFGAGGTGYAFNGIIDNVRVTARALSAAEIAANYQFRTYLPTMTYRFPSPPKSWTGMHLGNRNNSDWSTAMLAPLDPAQGSGGVWPQVAVVLSSQVFTVTRDANCKILTSGISIRSTNLYNYIKRAAQGGTTAVMVRVYPSPGNFAESIDPSWPITLTRPAGRTLLSGVGQRPGGWSQCNNEWRFRTVDDIGDEMLAIQRYASNDGWQVFGFEPANEPNVEWYSNPAPPDGNEPSPSYLIPDAWHDMDDYFSIIYGYVQSAKGSTSIRVFTPPMSQNANAEIASVRSEETPCEEFDFSGYEEMTQTFNSPHPANDGYSWHNYFNQTKEQWADCPNGMHVSMWFPQHMTYNIINGFRLAFITEADLAPPQFVWDNLVTNKDTQAVSAANSIRDFLDYERNASNGWGARRVAVWLLHDDTDNQQHTWAQAWNGTAFRQWFNEWWYRQEPHIP